MDSGKRRCGQLRLRSGEAVIDIGCGPGYLSESISMQVVEYIPGMREMARVLKPGGRALAVATDWDALVCHSENPPRMQRVLQRGSGIAPIHVCRAQSFPA